MKKKSTPSRQASTSKRDRMVLLTLVLAVAAVFVVLLFVGKDPRLNFFRSDASENGRVIVKAPEATGAYYAGGPSGIEVVWIVNPEIPPKPRSAYPTKITLQGKNLAGQNVEFPITTTSKIGSNKYIYLVPEFEDLRNISKDMRFKIDVTLRVAVTPTPTPIPEEPEPTSLRRGIRPSPPTPRPGRFDDIANRTPRLLPPELVTIPKVFSALSGQISIIPLIRMSVCEKTAVNNQAIRCSDFVKSDKPLQPLDILGGTSYVLNYSIPKGAKKCILKTNEATAKISSFGVNVATTINADRKANRFHYQIDCDYGGGINPSSFVNVNVKQLPVISLCIGGKCTSDNETTVPVLQPFSLKYLADNLANSCIIKPFNATGLPLVFPGLGVTIPRPPSSNFTGEVKGIAIKSLTRFQIECDYGKLGTGINVINVDVPVSVPAFVCDYPAPPAGCGYVPGPDFNPTTQCGKVLLRNGTLLPCNETPTPTLSPQTIIKVISPTGDTHWGDKSSQIVRWSISGDVNQVAFYLCQDIYCDGSSGVLANNTATHLLFLGGSDGKTGIANGNAGSYNIPVVDAYYNGQLIGKKFYVLVCEPNAGFCGSSDHVVTIDP